MRTTMDSIFEVGFGFELNTLSGSDESSIEFSKAFDEANSLVYYRYVDMFWKLKRHLNIGSEAKLNKSIKIIDNFHMGWMYGAQHLPTRALHRHFYASSCRSPASHLPTSRHNGCEVRRPRQAWR
jgi:hypothetical protein